jgi:hypothetical protein
VNCGYRCVDRGLLLDAQPDAQPREHRASHHRRKRGMAFAEDPGLSISMNSVKMLPLIISSFNQLVEHRTSNSELLGVVREHLPPLTLRGHGSQHKFCLQHQSRRRPFQRPGVWFGPAQPLPEPERRSSNCWSRKTLTLDKSAEPLMFGADSFRHLGQLRVDGRVLESCRHRLDALQSCSGTCQMIGHVAAQQSGIDAGGQLMILSRKRMFG